MKIKRTINSIPIRSAAETWKVIVDLMTGKESKYKADLDAVAGVMASIITDEHPAKEPFIVNGVGDRLVIYCQYASKAVTDDENAAALPWNPTAGDWWLKVPCDAENLSWVKAALAKKSRRVTAYNVDSPEDEKETTKAAAGANVLEIDWTAGGAR